MALKRLLLTYALICGALFAASPCFAQVPMTGAGLGAPASGAPAVTWNPADVGAGVTLSSGNLVATGSSANAMGRATTSHSTGKYCYEWTATVWTTTELNIGWASAGLSLSTGILYGQSTSAGFRVTSAAPSMAGQLYFDYASPGAQSVDTSANGMNCIDFGADIVWTTIDGSTWTGSGNPATGSGGQSISGLSGTPWFPAFVVQNAGTANVVTARFASASFVYSTLWITLSAAGFSQW